MPNRLKPSKNAVTYSLVDENPYVGIPPIKPVTVPDPLYARDSVTEAPTMSLLEKEENGLLVDSIEGEVRKWYIEYAERHDAYDITKENDRGVGWVAPADDERQITPIVEHSLPPHYPSEELFRFKYSD
ncbi:hypothetical protein EDC04DRAFT_2889879 [Pisolithus marmoratus]|nr:hypothetical protein EDC04DRAFT_2889879 [Pisolithus marmoratus]